MLIICVPELPEKYVYVIPWVVNFDKLLLFKPQSTSKFLQISCKLSCPRIQSGCPVPLVSSNLQLCSPAFLVLLYFWGLSGMPS